MSMAEQSLGQIAQDVPGATAVFHKYGLDFCCGGKKSLVKAASDKGLDIEALISDLSLLAQSASSNDGSVTGDMDDQHLIEYILTRFHDVHREQLPELIRLANRVELVHRDHPLCPAGLVAQLEKMSDALESHMQREEQILFPMIARGLHPMARQPVQVMRHEHDDHGDELAKLEQITHGIKLPENACNTWRALYLGLQTLKEDLMQHIHLENNVLFSRVDGQLGGARQD